MKNIKIAFVAILCLLAFKAYPQTNTTNKGTDFWLAYMQNIRGIVIVNGSPCALDVYITSDLNTTGTITFADGSPPQSFTVTANQINDLIMPQSSFLDAAGQFAKGIHITSVLPIVVFAHIHANAVSGATLLLPVNTLGKDYYSINYTQQSNEATAYSAFNIVATEDSTVVNITPTAPLITGESAGNTFSINMKAGDVYQGLSATDLTGTRIQSVSVGTKTCKKIAVFSGSSKIFIGCNDAAHNTADNLFQQVYPTASWGKNYYTAPLKNRQYDIYRIIISDPSTNVILNGNAISITNGLYYEFPGSTPNIITADKPIQVVQYAVTQGKTLNCVYDNNDLGDPEMIFLTPVEQTITQATLYSTPKENITAQYINVIIKTASASTFTIDGAAQSGFSTFNADASYSYGQFTVSSGTHTIQASDGFNAIAYGFGQYESYGYAAGTNLKNLNEYLQFINPQTNTVVTSGCTSQNFNASVALPYQTTKLTWNLKNGSAVYTDNSPKSTATIQKGTQTLYVYNYPSPVSYPKAGTYDILVTAFNPVADVCGSTDDIDLNFSIIDPPIAKFSSRDTICMADTIQFHDLTNGLGTAVGAWHYDFNDGDTSALQSPVYSYLKPGDYKVTLTATGATGCISNPFIKNVHVYAMPVARFSASSPDCVTRAVTFTDQSTSAERPVKRWVYDFGDGSAVQTQTSKAPFSHIFTKTGTFGVKLYNITDKGCAGSTFIDSVTVYPLPVINITLPDICISDGTAHFTDQSTIADNSAANFTYLWNFGDAANSTPANPNTSTAKNPNHAYTNPQPANYNLSLTITSNKGCSITLDTTFTVNGANPTAAFSVLNPGQLCSDHEVFFMNNSSVSFGSVTKIVMQYDLNDPTSIVTYVHPKAGQLFRHSYPVFYSGTKTYTVRMIAYSGGVTCVSTPVDVVITLLPVSKIVFAQPAPVCLNAATVNLQGYVTQTGASGPAGIFSGDGVSGSSFIPSAAGVGTHTIRYIFTAANACADTATQTIKVNPLPVVTIGPDTSILLNNKIKIIATAVGDSLSYQWSPAAGLSSATILNPVASPVNTTKYILTVTGQGVCTTTAAITIKVLYPPIVPNTFTPNGDGVNDTWVITHLSDYSNSTVEVYNRTGQLLYTSIGYGTPWDGRYNGQPLPVGTYYYVINPKHGRATISGYVAILR